MGGTAEWSAIRFEPEGVRKDGRSIRLPARHLKTSVSSLPPSPVGVRVARSVETGQDTARLGGWGPIFMPNDYALARQTRKEGTLPPSDKKTLTPKYLIQHENHFDPNTYTPEQLIQKGVLKGKLDSVQQT
jgi:hypothetical protein